MRVPDQVRYAPVPVFASRSAAYRESGSLMAVASFGTTGNSESTGQSL